MAVLTKQEASKLVTYPFGSDKLKALHRSLKDKFTNTYKPDAYVQYIVDHLDGELTLNTIRGFQLVPAMETLTICG